MSQAGVSTRYDDVARSLHWASALLIVAAFVIGLAIDVPPKPWYPLWLNTHVLIGLGVLVLALARLGWRAGHPAPPLVAGTTAPMAFAVKLGHAALYLAMIAVPLIGLAPLFTRGIGIGFGLFEIASPIARQDRPIVHNATEIHEIAAYALVALAVGHILAAFYHHFAMRDGLLLRMMPQRKQ